MQLNTPVYHELLEFSERHPVRFHFPGHKGRSPFPNALKDVYDIDITETYGTDNLQDPTGVIKESLDKIARVYGAKECMFSVNGTTGGIHIAIATVTNPGDKVLIARSCHQSVYNALILNGLEVEYLYPDFDIEGATTLGVSYDTVAKGIEEHPEATCVMLLNPNFYGNAEDLGSIADLVHRHGMILLVDEAHGSHLNFTGGNLPKSALECGADIVIDSSHKTLPSLTQTSLILVGSDRVDHDKFMEMVRLYQTSSPSYLFMASLELAAAYMDSPEGRHRLEENLRDLKEVREKIRGIEGVHLYGVEDSRTYDFTKLLFRVEGLTGIQLSDELYHKHNIILEMADMNYGLAITSLMNSREDLEKLHRALECIAEGCRFHEKTFLPLETELPKNERVLSLKDAFYQKKEKISIREAVGKISASIITPYPPGIPLVVPGERISEETMTFILRLKEKGLKIVGMTEEQIYILRG